MQRLYRILVSDIVSPLESLTIPCIWQCECTTLDRSLSWQPVYLAGPAPTSSEFGYALVLLGSHQDVASNLLMIYVNI